MQKRGGFRGRKSRSWEEKREIRKSSVTENVEEKFREHKKNEKRERLIGGMLQEEKKKTIKTENESEFERRGGKLQEK